MKRPKDLRKTPRSVRDILGSAADAVLDAQIAEAKERQRALRKSGRVAVDARYDAKHGRVDIQMSNGAVVGIPVSEIPSLVGATPEQLAAVEVDELGSGLRWDALDVDVGVPGVIVRVLGMHVASATLGAAGGRSRTEKKAAAARENGKKGGRPRTRPDTGHSR